MAITYERVMKITYGKKLSYDNFKRFACELAKKGAYITNGASSVIPEEHQYREITKEDTTYNIIVDGDEVMTVSYRSDAVAIVEGFCNLFDEINYEEVQTKTTKKDWPEVYGHTLAFDLDGLEGETQPLDIYANRFINYDNDVGMIVTISNQWDGLYLQFKVILHAKSVMRKEAIEEAMVETPLKDMGLIQSLVESRLRLKKFGFDTEDVSIDCHFDAKTESRSECTPDIIKQVREARKK